MQYLFVVFFGGIQNEKDSNSSYSFSISIDLMWDPCSNTK